MDEIWQKRRKRMFEIIEAGTDLAILAPPMTLKFKFVGGNRVDIYSNF